MIRHAQAASLLVYTLNMLIVKLQNKYGCTMSMNHYDGLL